jgi:hypothetical protein
MSFIPVVVEVQALGRGFLIRMDASRQIVDFFPFPRKNDRFSIMCEMMREEDLDDAENAFHRSCYDIGHTWNLVLV